MSVNILTTRLFRLRKDALVWPDIGGPRTIKAGVVVWQHGTRKSSFDSYIGTYSLTYRQVNGISPKPGIVFQLNTELLEALC